MIDTHIHLDGEEFREDLPDVIARAKQAGAEMLFLPGINTDSLQSIPAVCRQYPDFLKPMYGLHPEDVNTDWEEVLAKIKSFVFGSHDDAEKYCKPIAIGEVGLDYYWSREFEREQLMAFEQQVRWSVETQLPLMIHCRKAQNEMVKILKKYKANLPGGVFHCFTGNQHEAEELLEFPNFMLGIGGVLTFKKSNLPETLQACVPLSRIVLETDAPYMAPVPMRGKRNESSYITFIIEKLANIYNCTPADIDYETTKNAKRVFCIVER